MKARLTALGRSAFRLVLCAMLAWSVAVPALTLGLLGNGFSSVRISGNRVVAEVDLAGLAGTQFILEFEQVQNLTVSNLGLGASLLSPLDLLLRDRMPDDSGLLSLALPLVISVEPPKYGGLAFRNTVRAELHTHLLGYTLDSPLRLYKAPRGGTFHDITNAVLEGSVRTSGRTGGFSDFIMVVDLLPSTEQAEDKLSYLELRARNPAIPASVQTLLANDLARVRSSFEAGDHASAIAATDAFIADVRARSGSTIPNLWRSQRDRDNLAGDLIGTAESLRFSLDRASR